MHVRRRHRVLYGSPVPGYRAPAERTVGPGTRVVGAMFNVIAAGDIPVTNVPAAQPLSSGFARLRAEFGFPGDDSAVAKYFLLWAGLVGAISLEVFGPCGADTLTEPEAVFDIQVRMLIGALSR